MTKIFSLTVVLLCFVSCKKEKAMHITEIQHPFQENSIFPNVFSTGNEVLISYILPEGDNMDNLYFVTFKNEKFSTPHKIADGADWFVNWADIPSIAKSGNNIISTWLDKSDKGTYDYDIKMSISNDNGATWNEAFIPHKDGIAAEHGFVSITVNDEGNFLAVWLDGRNTKIIDESGNEIHGQMTLRSAIIHPDGSMSHELEIDNRVCDCCQTDILQSEIGAMVVYRDRTEEEIRDHYFSLFKNGEWTDPKAIYNDHWKIGGCPVNGPVLASHANDLSAAWYTEGNGIPEVYLSKYNEAEGNFLNPILISDYGVMGRLDLEYMEDGNLVIIWLEDAADHKALVKAKVFDSNLNLVEDLTLGHTLSARKSGFPKVVKVGESILLIYMDEEGGLVTKLIEPES